MPLSPIYTGLLELIEGFHNANLMPPMLTLASTEDGWELQRLLMRDAPDFIAHAAPDVLLDSVHREGGQVWHQAVVMGVTIRWPARAALQEDALDRRRPASK